MKRWILGLAILCFGCGEGELGTTAPSTGAGGAGGRVGGAGGSSPAASKVLVTNQQHAPLPGVPVVAHDEEGSPLEQAITDDVGEATLVVPPGGSVSALHAAGQRFQLRTVVAPPSGTVVLVVETPPAAPAPHAVTSYVLKLGSYPAGANMIVASMDGGCATAQAPAGADIPFNDAACPDRASHTVWLGVLDQENKLLGWGQAVLGTQPGKSVAAYVPALETALTSITLEIDNLPETGAAPSEGRG